MQNSLILFSFDTLEDREYFTKITTLKTTGIKHTLRIAENDSNEDP
jgi:Holliday junction resolvasome RuvABC DNA-binding subunit